MHGEVTAREDPSSKGTLGHLAVQRQAGLGSAPVQGGSARIHTGVSEMHSYFPQLAALSRSLGFAVCFQMLSSFSVLRLVQVGLYGSLLLIAAHATSLGGFCRKDLLVREHEEDLDPKSQQSYKLVSLIVPGNTQIWMKGEVAGLIELT